MTTSIPTLPFGLPGPVCFDLADRAACRSAQRLTRHQGFARAGLANLGYPNDAVRAVVALVCDQHLRLAILGVQITLGRDQSAGGIVV